MTRAPGTATAREARSPRGRRTVRGAAVSEPLPVLIGIGPDDRRAWVRVARALLADIDAGKFRPGDRLPARSVLAARFGVSPPTVQRAQVELARAGIIGHGHAGHSRFRVTRNQDPPAARPRAGDAAPARQAPARAAARPVPRGGTPRPAGPQVPRLLTVRECAGQARVGTRTVYRLIRTGAVESTRIGRSYRVYADSWLAYLNSGWA